MSHLPNSRRLLKKQTARLEIVAEDDADLQSDGSSDVSVARSCGDENVDWKLDGVKGNLNEDTQDAYESITSLPPELKSEPELPFGAAMTILLKNGSISTLTALSSRTKTIDSIEWLAKHVPRCVLAQLIDEIKYNRQESAIGDDLGNAHCFHRSSNIHFGNVARNEEKRNVAVGSGQMPSKGVSSRRLLDTLARKRDASMGFVTFPLPNVKNYKCALLFIDISGFTALSVLLDVESLSKAINDYFQMIVDTVISHGGDILKFAGDALFAEWRCVTEEGKEKLKGVTSLIEDCVRIAAICGAKVVAECSDYPIYSTTGPGLIEGEQLAALNVHCGLGVGELTSVHVGNYHTRRELLVMGDPIEQVSKAEGAASLGELAASPEALSLLSKTCNMTHLSMEKGVPTMIASRKDQYFAPRQRKEESTNEITKKVANMLFNFEGMDTMALKHLRRKLALYVHTIVVQSETSNNSFRLYNSFTRRNSLHRAQAQAERYRAEAELRSVYTMFIMPLVNTERTSDTENTKLYQLLNNIMNLVTDTLESFMGHLRQFIVDDKGVVLIATFGLRGSTTPNMILERAIPATRFLHRTLKSDLGVDNHIGGTIGKAYCGVVGGMHRHEYAVLGPSVNLAARLMSLPKHPGILVDDEVRKIAGMKANFRPLKAVKAKGYVNLVPIFQPLTATERRWGEVNPHFVGRKAEVDKVVHLAEDMASSSNAPAKMYFCMGGSGSGKSALVVQTIALLSKAMTKAGKDIIVTRNVSNEGDSHVPFSLFRSIFQDILLELELQPDDYASYDDSDDSDNSYNGVNNPILDKDWDQMSMAAASSARADNNFSIERIAYLCKEIGAPKGFLEIVGHHLLGHAKRDDEGEGRTAKMDEIVNVMAQAFVRCTIQADLVVLAMDDVHNVDRMSWKVIRKIFETCQNLLIFCGSRPFSSRPFKTEKTFWSKLKGQYTAEKRFHFSELGPLKQCDITEMISKCFGCTPIEIDGTLSMDVFVQSGGMPYYTSEILANISRKNSCEQLENGKIGWRRTADISLEPSATSLSFSSLDELIVNRIDNLGESVREILFIAAALGVTFELTELLAVYEQIYSISLSDRESATDRVCGTVELALKEHIFEESFHISTEIDDANDDDDGRDINVDIFNNSNDCDVAIDKPESKGKNSVLSGENSDGIAPQKSVLFDENSDGIVPQKRVENRQYRFYNDAWRRNTLALLLDSRKKDILRNAGVALEKRCKDGNCNYRTKMQLLRYWKESGHTSKATELALKIGKKFNLLGLNTESIDVYTDVLNMWQKNVDAGEKLVCGFPIHVIGTIDIKTSKIIVSLLISKGQAHGNLLEGTEGVAAYRSALQIAKMPPLSTELDRTFTFQIFSGMQFLLKYGSVVEPQQEIVYEQELVASFIHEARQCGNPIHYIRALAMEVDFYCIVGQYERALNSHSSLEDIYNVDEHSTSICEAYGSDPSAQSFGFCARCHHHLGNTEKSLKLCDYVVENLMPKMDITNVHNSLILFYPILWIWKDNNLGVEALSTFRKYIVEAFNEHYGEDATTPAHSFFKPIEMLLAIFTNELSKESVQEYIGWVRDKKNTSTIPNSINRAMLRFGRCANSIFAEIFLLLSQRCDIEEARKDLIIEGLEHACVGLDLAEGKNGSPRHQTAFDQVKPVYDQLVESNQFHVS